MQMLGLFGVLVGEYALRFFLLLYALPFFLLVVGYQFIQRGRREAASAVDSSQLAVARKQSADGGKVMLFALALAVLIFFRVELFRCVVHLL